MWDLNFGYVDYTTKIVPRWNSQEGYTPAKQPLYSDPKLHKVTDNCNGIAGLKVIEPVPYLGMPVDILWRLIITTILKRQELIFSDKDQKWGKLRGI